MKAAVKLVVLRKFGRAYVEGDVESADHFRELMEDTFELEGATYELVRVAFDPLLRYRTGRVDERTEAMFGEEVSVP